METTTTDFGYNPIFGTPMSPAYVERVLPLLRARPADLTAAVQEHVADLSQTAAWEFYARVSEIVQAVASLAAYAMSKADPPETVMAMDDYLRSQWARIFTLCAGGWLILGNGLPTAEAGPASGEFARLLAERLLHEAADHVPGDLIGATVH